MTNRPCGNEGIPRSLRAVAALQSGVTAAVMLLIVAEPAAAQMKWDRPITIIVPFPPGGAVDLGARQIADKVRESGGPTMVVLNKPGAGGIVGALAAKQAPPDGHTLFAVDMGTFGINSAMKRSLPYDPVRDFTPITLYRTNYQNLSVPVDLPVRSVADLVALGKTRPAGLSYASQGVASGGHLQGALFAKATGTPMVHVAYQGQAAAMTDLVAGRVDLLFGSYDGVSSFVDAGKLKIIAVAGKKRYALLPDIPTLEEVGYVTDDFPIWSGFVAPAGTPPDAAKALNALIVRAANAPEIVNYYRERATDITTNTPAQFADFISQSLDRMARIVKEADIPRE
jgi:tripartite-type tricarboxylate transporter receptor subunit TctC